MEIGQAGTFHLQERRSSSGEYQVVLTPGARVLSEPASSQTSGSWLEVEMLEGLGSSARASELLRRSHLSSSSQLSSNSSDPVAVTLRSQQSSESEGSLTVECHAGYTCVGGGCVARQPTDFVVSERDPAVDGWRCMSGDETADKTKKVWAICALSCATYTGDCSGHRVVHDHHMCAAHPCTAAECCKPAPKCENFRGKCPHGTIPKHADTSCTSGECSAEDCCGEPQRCTEWSGSCSCAGASGGTIQIPNFAHHVCTGHTCTEDECCEEAPTCSSFEDSSCVGTRSADATCCSGSCNCAFCYA